MRVLRRPRLLASVSLPLDSVLSLIKAGASPSPEAYSKNVFLRSLDSDGQREQKNSDGLGLGAANQPITPLSQWL